MDWPDDNRVLPRPNLEPVPVSPHRISRRTLLRTGSACATLQALSTRGGLLAAAQAPRYSSESQPSPLMPPKCLVGSRVSYPPLLERFIQKLNPASDVFPSEVYVATINKTLKRWSQFLCNAPLRGDAIRENASPKIIGSFLKPLSTSPLRTTGVLRVERCTFSDELVAANAFLQGWASWLAPFASIDVAEFEIFGIRILSDSPLKVETEISYNVVGRATDDAREQRVGTWVLSWSRKVPGEEDVWTVEQWVAHTELRSRLTGPGFTDVTSEWIVPNSAGMAQLNPGIDLWRGVIDGASGIDVYGNHGVAVGDIDGSGFDSFYVCQPSGLPNRLYRNRGSANFEDITEHSGTGILDGTASALFVDFLNRGKQDLLVVRSSGPLLFLNQGDGRFLPRPDAFHFARPPQGTFTSAAAADYNGDGLLDVYFCVYSYYQGLSQYSFPSPFYDAQNGPPNFLFRNRGDGTFEDLTAASGMDSNNNRFSFAAAWCDRNNNGHPDLYVANDFGRKNLYRNNGDGTFTDVAHEAGVEDYGPGMSACWLDYDNDGLQDVYVANMWLAEGKRITADEHFLPEVDPAIRKIYQKHNAGNSLYRNKGDGTFEDKSAAGGTLMGGWSWSSDTWDFDHDGYPDLYVANGFVSGEDRDDLQGFFWRQVVQCSAVLAEGSPDYELAWNAVNELVRSDYSWAGYQRNVFFLNNRDRTFSEVGGALGLDLIDDSRAFALSDFNHDGRLEFVLKNRTGPQLRILRNDLGEIGNSIAFRLTGHTSNRDAIGTVITIEAGAIRQSKFLSAGSGFASQHTKELFFGLGSATGPISISVRWPTGKVQHFTDLPANHRVEIEEGKPDFHSRPFESRIAPAQGPGESKVSASVPKSTWLIEPLIGPSLALPDLSGQHQQLSALRGSPVLISFFRLDCGESRRQLEMLQHGAADLAASGISVRAVALKAVVDLAEIKDFAKSARISFPILLSDDRTSTAWNIQYRYLFDRRRDIEPPTTLLLDATGSIICIYHDLVDTKSIVHDWTSAPTTPEQRFARAMPFAGPYYGNAIRRDYFTFGVAFIEYGYTDEAQAAFKRVIEIDPGYANAWFNLGTIYLNNKQYDDARRCLKETLRLSPSDADAWNNLGLISGEEGKYDEALEEFRSAARANPNYELAVQNMLRIYQFKNLPAEAQKAMEELIALAPQNSGLHLGLAMTLVAQNSMPPAIEQLQTAIRLKPNNTEARNNLGAVFMRIGRNREALDQFEECRRLAPDFDRPYINSALAYRASGQSTKANEVLQEFLIRHPDNTDVRNLLEKQEAQ
ncbi:FG-GAP-like repeat-containing protein [Tunturiibacter gelidoferens]|uniref:Tetratricopeptide (TPR) repeat protein/peroxiredoxin n=1 Tax=Tunturiibacter gelidiferens TaxID=3069689 RepID=A0A9X0QCR4_9BACT|nr:FG-GAP-like repeat-containing protein [Edaphobacter lichenicola]MBB5327971.1 tetratricopeptide (TPR) repeat protein/peroxiredoxin [Edaphobacter lichenicola]